MVVLILMRRQPPRRAALLLGLSATLLVLFNPETGLCLAFGYSLFLLSRLRNFDIVPLVARAVAGAVIAVVFFFEFLPRRTCRVARDGGVSLLGFITHFGQGYGSLPIYFDPLALVIFSHSAYVVVFTTMQWWRRRNLRFKDSVKFAVAAVILVWLSYYINRPHPWNLWTFKFLYAFLVADFLEPRLLGRLWRRGVGAVADARLAVPTFILLPLILSTNYFIWQLTLNSGPGRDGACCLVSASCCLDFWPSHCWRRRICSRVKTLRAHSISHATRTRCPF